jgi:hypothetical protein
MSFPRAAARHENAFETPLFRSPATPLLQGSLVQLGIAQELLKFHVRVLHYQWLVQRNPALDHDVHDLSNLESTLLWQSAPCGA